jgi:cell division protein FtsB
MFRSSRRSYQPSLVSAGGSNTSALQKLSATQNQLEREFEKLQSAVAKNKYDSKVFD